MKHKHIIVLIGLLLAVRVLGQAQDPRLAEQYYNNGEYEKAAVIFEQLYKKNPSQDYYFNRYVEVLILLENYKETEKELKKRIKEYPQKVELYVSFGELYERQFDQDKANEQYKRSLENLPKDRAEIIKLAEAYSKLTKYDLALETYKIGAELMKDKKMFAYELGDLYLKRGDRKEMIENYILSLEQNPSRLNSLKTIFQRFFTDDDYKELQAQLYEQINAKPEETIYNDLLAWVFIQKEDYKNALRQLRALDKRLKETGGRVYSLAQTAQRAKDYDAAIAGYSYIIEEKGRENTYYVKSQEELLECKRLKVVEGFTYTEAELRELEREYEKFLTEFGRDQNSGKIIFELAALEAFYINDLDKAIDLLDELINMPGVRRHLLAEAKLSLGDYYLMTGEIWESTLLYSQVDKEYKDDILGQTARFKNAKLSYFKGDFEWAQTQFSVLKGSTSKLIANDALDLSVFILDNLALDTVLTPMQLYSKAELLIFQNRFEESFSAMDTIVMFFPGHSLQDDIYYAKAKIYTKQRDYTKAAEMYQAVLTEFPESIRVDNSLFALAELNELHLNDKEKARKLYEQIIFDYSDSTFTVEARKRFKVLNDLLN
jgi:tetratricopeptide (TPR) repeat protein